MFYNFNSFLISSFIRSFSSHNSFTILNTLSVNSLSIFFLPILNTVHLSINGLPSKSCYTEEDSIIISPIFNSLDKLPAVPQNINLDTLYYNFIIVTDIAQDTLPTPHFENTIFFPDISPK